MRRESLRKFDGVPKVIQPISAKAGIQTLISRVSKAQSENLETFRLTNPYSEEMWESCDLLSQLVLKWGLGSHEASDLWLQQSPPWTGTCYRLSCASKSFLSFLSSELWLSLLGPLLGSTTQHQVPAYYLASSHTTAASRDSKPYTGKKEGWNQRFWFWRYGEPRGWMLKSMIFMQLPEVPIENLLRILNQFPILSVSLNFIISDLGDRGRRREENTHV